MKLIPILLMMLLSTPGQASLNKPILFEGSLQNSCDFINNQSVLDTLDSLSRTLEDINDDNYRCQSIYNNSKALLNSLTSSFAAKDNELTIVNDNIDTLTAEVYKYVQLGTYAGQYDAEIFSLQRRKSELESEDQTRSTNIINSLELSSTILNDLQDAPDCDQDFGNNILRPSILMMGQVAGAVYPGSNFLTNAAANGFANVVDSFVSYASFKGSAENRTLDDLYRSRNYYASYKCAYKNLNATTCNLRRATPALKDAKWLYNYIQKLDTPNKDFKRVKDLRSNYPRFQKILNELRDIYESANQQDTIVTIATIQKEQAKLKILQPSPFYVEEWSDEYQNIKTWTVWSQTLSWFGKYNAKMKSYCREFEDGKYWIQERSDCEASSIAKDEIRTKYIQEVIKPSLEDLQADKERLSDKLRTTVNIERLYKVINAEDNWRDNTEKFSISQVVEIFEEDLDNTTSRPEATKLFAVRIRKALKALKALINFDQVILGGPNMKPEQCDIEDEDMQCTSFKDLAQAAYTYLANNLSDGDVLSVETIDASFYNYIGSVEEYFLFGLPQKSQVDGELDYQDSLNFSRYMTMVPLYRHIKKNLTLGNNSGSSNIPLLNRARVGFERVFGKEIISTLKDNVKESLKYGEKSDLYRDTIHACAIYYPMVAKKVTKSKSTSGLRRTMTTRSVEKSCKKLLEKNGGIGYLGANKSKYPLNNEFGRGINSQCYYRDYTDAVTAKKAQLARELDQNDDLPDL